VAAARQYHAGLLGGGRVGSAAIDGTAATARCQPACATVTGTTSVGARCDECPWHDPVGVDRIALRVDGSTVDHWNTRDAVFRRGAASYAATSATHVTRDPRDRGPNGDENDFAAVAGTGEPAGTWEFVIPTPSYAPDDRDPESPVNLQGPWTLEVIVP
jgi:hypothetical protein